MVALRRMERRYRKHERKAEQAEADELLDAVAEEVQQTQFIMANMAENCHGDAVSNGLRGVALHTAGNRLLAHKHPASTRRRSRR